MLVGACGGAPGKPPAENTPPVRTGYLDVPGARLYYETRGSGQPLLMIHGGAVDAGSFAAIAPELAKNYLVITYGRRGNSRSRLDSSPTDLRLDQQADDAVRLLKELVDEPPHVFGSSGGGVVALELAARYGHHLGIVISHEPPVPAVLPDVEARQTEYDARLTADEPARTATRTNGLLLAQLASRINAAVAVPKDSFTARRR